MENNKKTLAIMLGTLLFLLVLAVVLLSVIIVSITGDNDPPVTSTPDITVTAPMSTDDPASSDPHALPSTPQKTEPVITTAPQSTVTPTNTDKPATGSSEVTTAPQTPTTTAPVVTRPPVSTDKVETITNPDGSVVKRGSFRDNGEQMLHLLVDWEAYYPEKDSKNVTLTVRLYLESNTIGVSARTNGVFTVGDDTIQYSTGLLTIRESATHHTLFVTRTLNYTKSNGSQPLELDISAAWNFDGSYSGVRIDWLRVNSTIEI